MPTRPRSFAASSLLVLLLGCRGGEEEPTHETGEQPAPTCGVPASVTWDLGCEAGAWSGFLWATDGCLDLVVLDAWAPLHHERHELQLVDDAAGSQTWVLGPILTEVEDWSPRVTSRWSCEELEGLTFALRTYTELGLLACAAWGPDAATVAELPGAKVDHLGCAPL